MKLAIITAIHGRPLMTVAFLKAMSRIEHEFGVKTYAVVTECDEENISSLEHYGINHIEHCNKPVGQKFNRVVKYLDHTDFTHVLILGSDDIPSSRFIEHTLTLDEYDIAGVAGLWFWGLNPRRAGFERFGYFGIKGVMAGAGKLVSRKVIEAVNYAPWGDRCNYGMDANMMKNIRDSINKLGLKLRIHRYSLIDTGGFLMDVKYGHHISSMSPIIRRESFIESDPYEVLVNHLPEDEIVYLSHLHKLAKEKEKK